MLSIRLSKQARDFVSNRPVKHQKQIVDKIESAASGNTQGTKMLRGYEPLRRVRSGDYRIVYQIDEQTVQVVIIDIRSRVYKEMKRKLK